MFCLVWGWRFEDGGDGGLRVLGMRIGLGMRMGLGCGKGIAMGTYRGLFHAR